MSQITMTDKYKMTDPEPISMIVIPDRKSYLKAKREQGVAHNRFDLEFNEVWNGTEKMTIYQMRELDLFSQSNIIIRDIHFVEEPDFIDTRRVENLRRFGYIVSGLSRYFESFNDAIKKEVLRESSIREFTTEINEMIAHNMGLVPVNPGWNPNKLDVVSKAWNV